MVRTTTTTTMNLFLAVVSLALLATIGGGGGAMAMQQQQQLQSSAASHHHASTRSASWSGGAAWGVSPMMPEVVTVVTAATAATVASCADEQLRMIQAAAGPATIEKEQVRTSSGEPAVLDRPQTERRERVDSPVKERSREGGEAWEVRIYNDGMNTREHVARSLVQITGMTEMTAYQTMMQAHQNGIAAVGRFCFEVAEMYNEGLRTHGIISDIVPVDEEN